MKEQDWLYCKDPGDRFYAAAECDDNKFTVLAGSRIYIHVRNQVQVDRLRAYIGDNGILKEDIDFSLETAAARFVSGGLLKDNAWFTEDGRTPDDVRNGVPYREETYINCETSKNSECSSEVISEGMSEHSFVNEEDNAAVREMQCDLAYDYNKLTGIKQYIDGIKALWSNQRELARFNLNLAAEHGVADAMFVLALETDDQIMLAKAANCHHPYAMFSLAEQPEDIEEAARICLAAINAHRDCEATGRQDDLDNQVFNTSKLIDLLSDDSLNDDWDDVISDDSDKFDDSSEVDDSDNGQKDLPEGYIELNLGNWNESLDFMYTRPINMKIKNTTISVGSWSGAAGLLFNYLVENDLEFVDELEKCYNCNEKLFITKYRPIKRQYSIIENTDMYLITNYPSTKLVEIMVWGITKSKFLPKEVSLCFTSPNPEQYRRARKSGNAILLTASEIKENQEKQVALFKTVSNKKSNNVNVPFLNKDSNALFVQLTDSNTVDDEINKIDEDDSIDVGASIQQCTTPIYEHIETIVKQLNTGYRIGKIDEMKFQSAYQEAYGESCDMTIVNRLIPNLCMKIGDVYYCYDTVLSDGQKKDLASCIENWLDDVTCIDAAALLEKLNLHPIGSPEELIRYLARCYPQYLQNDGLIGRNDFSDFSLVDEIVSIVENNSPCELETICHALYYISKSRILEAIHDSGDTFIVDEKNKRYMLSSYLYLDDDDEERLRKLIDNGIENGGSMSYSEFWNGLGEELQNPFAQFTVNGDPQILQQLLGYLLKDDYAYTKQAICRAGDYKKLQDILAQEFGYRGRVTMPEIEEVVQKYGLVRYQPKVFHYLYDHFCRISETEFVVDSVIMFDINDIDMALERQITDSYKPLELINLYILPTLSVTWNTFILGSYAYRFSNRFCLMNNTLTTKAGRGGVIAKQGCFHDYDEVLEHYLLNQGAFPANEKEAEFVLKDAGLISKWNDKIAKLYRKILSINTRG